ncbi:MAG: autotransporter domain-containing protein [Rhodospirillaceae bacterium]|nr:autotransporter domain-containing protein [Rhodospirillaceae bacterium]
MKRSIAPGRIAGCFAASMLAATALVQPAAAQQYSNMVVFGDSLSDAGRLFAITGGTNPASPPYVNGRFSNGPVWVELLAPKLGFTFSGATDFAVGGAESGTGGPVGVTTQVNGLAAATTFSANTLVVHWAGANDLLNRASTTPSATLIAQTVTNNVTNISTLAARGAKTILVGNLPDLGRTPGGVGSGNGTSLSALTQAYNASLVAQLPAIETARNTRIVVLNAFGLFNDVLANPSRYGISNTTIPCITPAGATGACATAATAAASAFFDPIHPTATSHAALADFAKASLDQDANVARIGAVTSFIAPQVLDTLRQTTYDRLNVLRITNGRERSTQPMSVYASAKYAKGDRDDGANVAGFDYDMISYTLGFDRVYSDGFVLGGAAHYIDGNVDLVNSRGTQDFNAAAFSAYFGYRNSNLWVDLSGAGSWENYDLVRNTGFAPRAAALGDTSGNSFYVALDAGVNLLDEGSAWSAGPIGGVRYLNADIDAYTETDAAMLNTSVAEQSNKSVIGSIGLQASGLFVSGGTAIAPHIRVVYENQIDKLDHAVAVTNDVGQVRRATGGTGTDDYILVGAGLNIQASSSLSFTLDYEGTIDRSDGKDHAVVGRVVYSF